MSGDFQMGVLGGRINKNKKREKREEERRSFLLPLAVARGAQMEGRKRLQLQPTVRRWGQ
jgi:hypothetical protein